MTQADQQNSDSALEAKTEPVREPSFHSFPDCALFAQVLTDLKLWDWRKVVLSCVKLGLPRIHTSSRELFVKGGFTVLGKGDEEPGFKPFRYY